MMAVDVRLSPTPQAPAEARRSLANLSDVDPELLERLRLLVSELVSNSVRHAGIRRSDEIRLMVHQGDDRVRVSVIDPGTGFEPHPRFGERDAGSGWGLFLVERLADRWGILSDGVTTVWFEVDR